MEIVSQNNVYLLYYLAFIFLYLKNSKPSTPNLYTTQHSCSAVANEHPSQTYFDTSFNLYIGQDFKTLLQKEPQCPTQTKKKPH